MYTVKLEITGLSKMLQGVSRDTYLSEFEGNVLKKLISNSTIWFFIRYSGTFSRSLASSTEVGESGVYVSPLPPPLVAVGTAFARCSALLLL